MSNSSTEFAEHLREAFLSRREVVIVVTACWYGCCHRAPFERAGYEQSYRGVIADLRDGKLLLHAIAVSTLNYHVVAELEHLVDVYFVEEGGS